MFCVMYFWRGSQVDNYKYNEYDTFKEALDDAFWEVERGICDKFDITKWENEDEGETYYIWEDGETIFDKRKEIKK